MSIYDQLRTSTSPLLEKFKNPKSPLSYERRLEVSDGGGGVAHSWDVMGSFDAIVIPASATEKQEAGRRSTQVSHKVLALHSDASGVVSSDRLIFDGRVLNVEYPMNIAKGDMWMRIMCMEGTAS